jgi:hypothetical protein
MKPVVHILVLVLLVGCWAAGAQEPAESAESGALLFIPNAGQWPDSIRYAARSDNCNWWFTDNGFYAHFTAASDMTSGDGTLDTMAIDACGRLFPVAAQIECKKVLLGTRFSGTPEVGTVCGVSPAEARFSFYYGNESSGRAEALRSYYELFYYGLYPGVNLRFYGNDNELEYDLILQPGADLNCVQFEIMDANRLTVSATGELLLHTEAGTVAQSPPLIYQVENGEKIRCSGGYQLIGDSSYSFILSADCDPSRIVVIDPVLSYSSYLGGSGHDHGRAVAVDDFGSVYIVGETESFDFPTARSAFDSGSGERDLFVTKLRSGGREIVYSTYFGGSGDEEAGGIAVDAAGRAYIAGTTTSPDLAVTAALQPEFGGETDCFLVALERDGNALMYSTYLGGSGADGVGGLTVDLYGNAHLVGYSTSTDYPLHNPLQDTRRGPQDAVLTKLSRDGSSLVFSTYLGGSADEAATDIAVDDQGDIYVVGNTGSTDFPIKHAMRTGAAGGQDAWLVKLDRSGGKLRFGTYLGGSGDDFAASVDLDQAGHAYITGSTASQDFPTYLALQPTNAGPWYQPLDLFLCKLTAAGDAFIFSTYLGGSDYDFLGDIAVDWQGYVFLAAATFSLDFPQVKPLRSRSRHQDAILAKLSPRGDTLLFSTYLGGVGNDWATSVAVNPDGEIYLTGDTRSPDFPIVRPLQRFNASGNFDAVVVRIEDIDYVCGDADGNGVASISDAVFLSNYIFAAGREPEPLLAADVDCNLLINISDVVYLISFVFGGWPQPCAECH